MVNVAVKGVYHKYYTKLRVEPFEQFQYTSCPLVVVLFQSSLYRAAMHLNKLLITYEIYCHMKVRSGN